jgi:hypothetical protein
MVLSGQGSAEAGKDGGFVGGAQGRRKPRLPLLLDRLGSSAAGAERIGVARPAVAADRLFGPVETEDEGSILARRIDRSALRRSPLSPGQPVL